MNSINKSNIFLVNHILNVEMGWGGGGKKHHKALEGCDPEPTGQSPLTEQMSEGHIRESVTNALTQRLSVSRHGYA